MGDVVTAKDAGPVNAICFGLPFLRSEKGMKTKNKN